MERKQQKTIGQQLFAERKKSGLTQAKLSQLSGISLFAIASLEQERSIDANTYTLRKLSKALNNYKFEI